jgi:hypothetical protein
MTEMELNTIVQHYVCRIFQETAKQLGVSIITFDPKDALRLNRAAAELEDILSGYVQENARSAGSSA